MGCHNYSEVKEEPRFQRVLPPKIKEIKRRRKKRISNRHSFDSEQLTDKQSSCKCDILVNTKFEKDLDISDLFSNSNRSIRIRKMIPKHIIENGITYDNDELLDYDDEICGIVFEETISEMNKINITKNAAIQMVKTAKSQSKYFTGRITKRLTEKQIEIIGEIIYEAITGERKYDILKPIKHPELRHVFIRVSLKPLTDEYKNDNCYKYKTITQKQINKAKKSIKKGKETHNIKVLSIQIC